MWAYKDHFGVGLPRQPQRRRLIFLHCLLYRNVDYTEFYHNFALTTVKFWGILCNRFLPMVTCQASGWFLSFAIKLSIIYNVMRASRHQEPTSVIYYICSGSDAYMRQSIRSSLVQMVVCRLFESIQIEFAMDSGFRPCKITNGFAKMVLFRAFELRAQHSKIRSKIP